MRPTRTGSSNFTYVGPTPAIADLPCRREYGAVYAAFELTDDERAMIASGAVVELGIFTEPIPPVSLRVVNEGACPGEDDLQCTSCRAIYVRARGLAACGQCGQTLAAAADLQRSDGAAAAALAELGAAACATVSAPGPYLRARSLREALERDSHATGWGGS